MPDVDSLNLRYIPYECEEAKTFLKKSFPRQVKCFDFNSLSELNNPLDFYLDELVQVSQRVTNKVVINRFNISQDNLVTLFNANVDKKLFGFYNCKLELSSVPSFSGKLKGSSIECLDLYGCGHTAYGDWDLNESYFGNLMRGLAQEEDFVKSLKKIKLENCGMNKSEIKSVLKECGFDLVQLVSC
ncbi:unnamed protein product [Moneuplotes crassus]|uniref:Uncharacterized protein n=1 Tax=Euplotes crassus TaxID=5936 RepID=A0AAD1U6R7_EUPCR|nr:unnamed protein product [Moneuplotes crassus]